MTKMNQAAAPSESDQDFISVCPHCFAETKEVGMDDEYVTYCSEECGCIEDVGSITVTQEQYEAHHG